MEVGIPELLLGQLDGLLQGNIVPREELLETMAQVVGRKVRAEQGEAKLALGKDLAKVVARVGGRLVVTGTYLVDGEQIRVTANVYERKAGAELARIDTCTVNGATSDLFGVADRLAEQVASRALTAMAPAAGTADLPGPAAAANYAQADVMPPGSPTLSQKEGGAEGKERASREFRKSLDQIAGRVGDKLALEKQSEKLNRILSGMRRGKGDRAKGGAPEPPAAPGKDEEESTEGEKSQGAEHGEPAETQVELGQAEDSLAKMKRFFENLRAVEDMDLSQQKALRNDQAFLESLCEEGCADTLKQKYESWQKANSVPRQEAQPAK